MARPGGIFCLDLSSTVGWAYGYPGDAMPICGTWLLPAGDLGRMLAAFDNELEDALLIHRPSLLMTEAPLPATAISNQTVWRQQLSLAGMADAAAYRHDIKSREQASSTIRQAILGTCRFPGGRAKESVVAYCVKRGWRVPDHNAADACITWEYACRHSTLPRLRLVEPAA